MAGALKVRTSTGPDVWTVVPGGGLDQATADTRYVNLAGGTMTGALMLPTSQGTTGYEAISFNFAQGTYVNLGGDTMTGLLTLSGAPSSNLHAATKLYVDTVDAKRLVPTSIGYSADGTWTKPANLVYVTVEVIGAGGGSGGCPLTAASQGAAAGGGGGGGYSRKRIMAATLGATETVTVGTGGTAGTTTTAGGTGETSSFGAHCSATGGAGGAFGVVRAEGWCANGGNGGTGSGGDINVAGGAGESGIVQNFAAMCRARGGTAGMGWGTPGDNGGSTAGSAGVTGKTYGGGAGGAFSCQSQAAAKAGGLGGGGLVFVTNWVWA